MRVSDGDTFVLESGEKVRMLMVDTPELGDNAECFGPEASTHTKGLLTGKAITLQYDVSCTDRFGRLLAYVFVDGQEINTQLVEQGYACVLHISPNGDDRVEEFKALEQSARQSANGLWAVCAKKPC
jgi:micrococcal nuclease